MKFKILTICGLSLLAQTVQADGLAFSFKHTSNPEVSAASETGFDGFGFSYQKTYSDRLFIRGGLHRQLETSTRPKEWQGEIEVGVYLFGGE